MPDYTDFLARLRGYERLEPLAKPRTPEKLRAIRELAHLVGDPHLGLNVVHVAGTNGKGLTSAMIAALLQRAGHRTGLYTSPHVLDIRERIGLGGAPIPPEAFARAGHAVLDQADRLRHRMHLSYFDLLTAIGLLAFRQAGCTWAVLETGLGGRADATNCAPKRLAVLTRIGLDHLHVLGDSLEQIAEEKVGIARAGVPTVLARQPESLRPWLHRRLGELGSPVLDCATLDGTPLGETFALPPELQGPRRACAEAALQSAALLLGRPGPREAQRWVETALAVHLPARLEWRGPQRLRPASGSADPAVFPQVVLDGGHNPDAMQALANELTLRGPHEYTLLFNLQADKLIPDLRKPLAQLFAGARRRITLTPQTIRAPSTNQLRAWLAEIPAPAPLELATSPRAALELAARSLDGAVPPLLACGSFWLLGDLLPELEAAE